MYRSPSVPRVKTKLNIQLFCATYLEQTPRNLQVQLSPLFNEG